MDLYAWVGEDETGDYGMKIVLTPLGPMNAVFARRRLAESPWVLQQMQEIANTLNRPMRLIHVAEADELMALTPNPQG
jgi:hypothetical protein